MKTLTRRIATIVLAVVAVLLLFAPVSSAGGHRGGHGHGHGHGHFHHHPHGGVFIGVGPWWWGPPYPYWWGYPPPYYAYAPPPVIVQQPPVYIQRPAPPAPPPPPEVYWHYCLSAKAYYPSVQTCPEAWVKVPPRTP